MEQKKGAAGGTLASVCMAGHVVATLLVVGPLLLLQLLGHLLATRFGATEDFLAQVLVAEPLMLVLLGTLGACFVGREHLHVGDERRLVRQLDEQSSPALVPLVLGGQHTRAGRGPRPNCPRTPTAAP